MNAGIIVALSLLIAHVTNAFGIIAPLIGNVGTAIVGIDKSVASAIDLKKIISSSKPKKYTISKKVQRQ